MGMDKDIQDALDKFGWVPVRTTGKHPIYEHPEHGRMPISTTKMRYRAKKNLLRDLERGPRSSGENQGDVAPDKASSLFEFQPVTHLTDALSEVFPNIDIGSISKVVNNQLNRHKGLTFEQRSCTDDDRVRYKLSRRTKYLYRVEDTKKNRSVLQNAGLDVEVPSPKKSDARVPTAPGVDWHKKAVEFKELFDAACEESDELRQELSAMEQDYLAVKDRNEQLQRQIEDLKNTKVPAAQTALQNRIDALEAQRDAHLKHIRDLKEKIEELEAAASALEQKSHAPVGDAEKRLAKARAKLTEMAQDNPSLYQVLYEIFA